MSILKYLKPKAKRPIIISENLYPSLEEEIDHNNDMEVDDVINTPATDEKSEFEDTNEWICMKCNKNNYKNDIIC